MEKKLCGRSGCNASMQRGAPLSSPRRHPLLVCTSCKTAAYCSRECQAAVCGFPPNCHKHQKEMTNPVQFAVRRAPGLETPRTWSHTAQQRRLVIHLQERRQIGDWRTAERIQKEALEVARKVVKPWPEGSLLSLSFRACFALTLVYRICLDIQC